MATAECGAERKLVLVCVDASEHSLRAFQWFHKYFYNSSHVIGLVNVFAAPNAPTFASGYPLEVYDGEYQRWIDDAVRKSRVVTDKFLELCKDRQVEARCFNVEKSDGGVGPTICKLAKERNASCVVMGQRGLGAIKRAVLGSVSDHVLHHAHITVLVVPPKKQLTHPDE